MDPKRLALVLERMSPHPPPAQQAGPQWAAYVGLEHALDAFFALGAVSMSTASAVPPKNSGRPVSECVPGLVMPTRRPPRPSRSVPTP